VQQREALFLSLMVTNCSGKTFFSRSKRIQNDLKRSQYSRRGCPHEAFGTLKVTNLGIQIVMNS